MRASESDNTVLMAKIYSSKRVLHASMAVLDHMVICTILYTMLTVHMSLWFNVASLGVGAVIGMFLNISWPKFEKWTKPIGYACVILGPCCLVIANLPPSDVVYMLSQQIPNVYILMVGASCFVASYIERQSECISNMLQQLEKHNITFDPSVIAPCVISLFLLTLNYGVISWQIETMNMIFGCLTIVHTLMRYTLNRIALLFVGHSALSQQPEEMIELGDDRHILKGDGVQNAKAEEIPTNIIQILRTIISSVGIGIFFFGISFNWFYNLPMEPASSIPLILAFFAIIAISYRFSLMKTVKNDNSSAQRRKKISVILLPVVEAIVIALFALSVAMHWSPIIIDFTTSAYIIISVFSAHEGIYRGGTIYAKLTIILTLIVSMSILAALLQPLSSITSPYSGFTVQPPNGTDQQGYTSRANITEYDNLPHALPLEDHRCNAGISVMGLDNVDFVVSELEMTPQVRSALTENCRRSRVLKSLSIREKMCYRGVVENTYRGVQRTQRVISDNGFNSMVNSCKNRPRCPPREECPL